MRTLRRPGGNIAERLLELGVAVIALAERLPRRTLTRHIGMQMVRAVTSGSANYEEACRAESRADFVHKVGVSAKELGEAFYWLRLVQRLGLADACSVIREADELIAILVASARTARTQ
jgi:four helix bundle protein